GAGDLPYVRRGSGGCHPGGRGRPAAAAAGALGRPGQVGRRGTLPDRGGIRSGRGNGSEAIRAGDGDPERGQAQLAEPTAATRRRAPRTNGSSGRQTRAPCRTARKSRARSRDGARNPNRTVRPIRDGDRGWDRRETGHGKRETAV